MWCGRGGDLGAKALRHLSFLMLQFQDVVVSLVPGPCRRRRLLLVWAVAAGATHPTRFSYSRNLKLDPHLDLEFKLITWQNKLPCLQRTGLQRGDFSQTVRKFFGQISYSLGYLNHKLEKKIRLLYSSFRIFKY